MVRCAWCSAVATADMRAVARPPRCNAKACCDASNALQSAMARWQSRHTMRATYAHAGAVWREHRAVVARDRNEQRGEPPDASGWTIW